MVGISFYFVGPTVTPNAGADQEWRQEAGWGYAGILAAAVVAGAIHIISTTVGIMFALSDTTVNLDAATAVNTTEGIRWLRLAAADKPFPRNG